MVVLRYVVCVDNAGIARDITDRITCYTTDVVTRTHNIYRYILLYIDIEFCGNCGRKYTDRI